MKTHAAVVAVAALFFAEAHTSQVHHQPITLADVVQFSDLVVVATPAEPPTRSIAIDITPKGQTPDPVKWPAYQRTWRRFVVSEVVVDHGTENTRPAKTTALKKGQVIEVAEATDAGNEAMHRSYYVAGRSESPIYEMYEAQGTTTSKARILLLRRLPTGLVFTQLGAEEFVEHRAVVDAAIKARTP